MSKIVKIIEKNEKGYDKVKKKRGFYGFFINYSGRFLKFLMGNSRSWRGL